MVRIIRSNYPDEREHVDYTAESVAEFLRDWRGDGVRGPWVEVPVNDSHDLDRALEALGVEVHKTVVAYHYARAKG